MGVEIDWSKAPEGATHYAGDDGARNKWLKVKPSGSVFHHDGHSWIKYPEGSPFRESHLRGSIARPEIAEWNGEGLPPAGTVCEAWHMGSEQGVVEVRYSGECMVLWSVSRKHEQCSASQNYTFKVLRTPEQMAEEERLHNVRNACTDISRTLDDLRGRTKVERAALAVIEAMIDAGYRKVTP